VRVIAGEAKGRHLKAVPGDTTRPVTDRVKEAVFNILQPDLEGATILDLFAGTGAIGIEALSRGAARAVFVDRAPKAVATVKENLRITGLADRAEVVRDDSFRFLERTTESFDIVYVAPPQYLGLWEKALQALDREKSAAGDLVVVQIHPKEYHPVELQYLELEDERKYGSTQVLFYVRREGGTDATSEGREDLDEGR
jgi:16S rRNA (guanine966-N2)-methyltransferase